MGEVCIVPFEHSAEISNCFDPALSLPQKTKTQHNTSSFLQRKEKPRLELFEKSQQQRPTIHIKRNSPTRNRRKNTRKRKRIERRRTHPIPLLIKQSSRFRQHLRISFLLAHFGAEIRRICMYLFRDVNIPSSTSRIIYCFCTCNVRALPSTRALHVPVICTISCF